MLLLLLVGAPLLLLGAACLVELRRGRRPWGHPRPAELDASLTAARATALAAGVVVALDVADGGGG